MARVKTDRTSDSLKLIRAKLIISPTGDKKYLKMVFTTKAGFVSCASIITYLRHYPFVFTLYFYVISHLYVML